MADQVLQQGRWERRLRVRVAIGDMEISGSVDDGVGSDVDGLMVISRRDRPVWLGRSPGCSWSRFLLAALMLGWSGLPEAFDSDGGSRAKGRCWSGMDLSAGIAWLSASLAMEINFSLVF